MTIKGFSITSFLAMDFPETKPASIPKDFIERQKVLSNVPEDSQKAKDIADYELIQRIVERSKWIDEHSQHIKDIAQFANDPDLKNKIWSIIESDENLKTERFKRLLESLNS